jgi:hypothetical protein
MGDIFLSTPGEHGFFENLLTVLIERKYSLAQMSLWNPNRDVYILLDLDDVVDIVSRVRVNTHKFWETNNFASLCGNQK